MRLRGRSWALWLVLALIALLVCGNVRTLYEGSLYLAQLGRWDPEAVRQIDPDGEFGLCHQLVALDNAGRFEAILAAVTDLGLETVLIPVPDEPLPSILVRLGADDLETLFVAHYDKSSESPDYQGASDNTAAVCALLSGLARLRAAPPERSIGILFCAAEERGLKGAESFVTWVRQQRVVIDEVINLDMVGRDGLAVRPEADPGLYFWLPGLGQCVYDGRYVTRATAYQQPNEDLVDRLRATLGRGLVVYRRFCSHSDGHVFQREGWAVATLSSDNIYYLDRVWETKGDRIELLDEVHLELVRDFVVAYASRQR